MVVRNIEFLTDHLLHLAPLFVRHLFVGTDSEMRQTELAAFHSSNCVVSIEHGRITIEQFDGLILANLSKIFTEP